MTESIHRRANGLQRAAEAFYLILTGGVLYYGIEVLFRGYSHWSMMLCGGVCLLLIYRMNRRLTHRSFLLRALLGALIITAIEFLTGCLVNLWWGMGVWDYSDEPYNLLGQICLPFSAIWFLLCIPAEWLCRLIRRFVFLGE